MGEMKSYNSNPFFITFRETELNETSVTCSVVGGEIAQEIVKVISQKDAEPFYNVFVFNGFDGSGTVETVL